MEIEDNCLIEETPPQIYYIADCHFFRERFFLQMEGRDFPSFEEMNEFMISQWNNKVREQDDVYILGDLSDGNADVTKTILRRLNGNHHLIIGNHDDYILNKTFVGKQWFKSMSHYQEITDNGRNVILSHYPIFCYKGQYRKDKEGKSLTYMLYGHVHNTHDESLVNSFIHQTRSTIVKPFRATEPGPIPCNMINCYCGFSNYQPMTLDEWIVIDEERRLTKEH